MEQASSAANKNITFPVKYRTYYLGRNFLQFPRFLRVLGESPQPHRSEIFQPHQDGEEGDGKNCGGGGRDNRPGVENGLKSGSIRAEEEEEEEEEKEWDSETGDQVARQQGQGVIESVDPAGRKYPFVVVFQFRLFWSNQCGFGWQTMQQHG